jgi:hypothetical protein
MMKPTAFGRDCKKITEFDEVYDGTENAKLYHAWMRSDDCPSRALLGLLPASRPHGSQWYGHMGETRAKEARGEERRNPLAFHGCLSKEIQADANRRNETLAQKNK